MMRGSRILAADEEALRSLQGPIGQRLHVGRHTTVKVTFLDTFDWRLHRTGSNLTIESGNRQRAIHWRTAERAEAYVMPIDGDVRFVSDLPQGFLRAELEPIVELRALLPVGSLRVERLPARVVDAEGDTELRLISERSTPLDASARPLGEAISTVSVHPLAGRNQEVQSIVDLLVSGGATEEGMTDPFAAAVAALGRYPGDYSPKLELTLKPKQRSDEAMRRILRRLFGNIEANVDGVLDDSDVEFLHDLRVAVRRTRSALSQLKDVLPRTTVEEFRPEFIWLGTVTGPCRDLDVNLLEMDGFKSMLGIVDDSLDPLQKLLERTRKTEHRKVVRSLRSARFQRLVDGWGEFLETGAAAEPEPSDAARPIVELGGKRILRAYLRVVNRGNKLDGDPPAEALHRLRIDAKKLRYLLEFFASLYPLKTVSPLVRELKRLQDILGGFNDMEIQQARLAELADHFIAAGEARSETVFEMGRLADAMADRQEEYRHAFSKRFASFAGADSRRLYRKTFV